MKIFIIFLSILSLKAQDTLNLSQKEKQILDIRNIDYLEAIVDDRDLMNCLFLEQLTKLDRKCFDPNHYDQEHLHYIQILKGLILNIYQEDNYCMTINQEGHFLFCEEHVKKIFLTHVYIVKDTSEFETKFKAIVHTFTGYYSSAELTTGKLQQPIQGNPNQVGQIKLTQDIENYQEQTQHLQVELNQANDKIQHFNQLASEQSQLHSEIHLLDDQIKKLECSLHKQEELQHETQMINEELGENSENIAVLNKNLNDSQNKYGQDMDSLRQSQELINQKLDQLQQEIIKKNKQSSHSHEHNLDNKDIIQQVNNNQSESDLPSIEIKDQKELNKIQQMFESDESNEQIHKVQPQNNLQNQSNLNQMKENVVNQVQPEVQIQTPLLNKNQSDQINKNIDQEIQISSEEVIISKPVLLDQNNNMKEEKQNSSHKVDVQKPILLDQNNNMKEEKQNSFHKVDVQKPILLDQNNDMDLEKQNSSHKVDVQKPILLDQNNDMDLEKQNSSTKVDIQQLIQVASKKNTVEEKLNSSNKIDILKPISKNNTLQDQSLQKLDKEIIKPQTLNSTEQKKEQSLLKNTSKQNLNQKQDSTQVILQKPVVNASEIKQQKPMSIQDQPDQKIDLQKPKLNKITPQLQNQHADEIMTFSNEEEIDTIEQELKQEQKIQEKKIDDNTDLSRANLFDDSIVNIGDGDRILEENLKIQTYTSEVEFLEQLEIVSSLKNKIDLLEEEKSDLIDKLIHQNDFEYKPMHDRLEQAVKEQTILNQIQEYKDDLRTLNNKMNEADLKLKVMLQSVENQQKSNRKLEVTLTSTGILGEIQNLNKQISENSRNLNVQRKSKAQILTNLMSLIKAPEISQKEDLKKQLLQSLSNVEYNLLTIGSRELLLEKTSQKNNTETRSLVQLKIDLNLLKQKQNEINKLSHHLEEMIHQEMDNAFETRAQKGQERSLLLRKMEQRERFLKETKQENQRILL